MLFSEQPDGIITCRSAMVSVLHTYEMNGPPNCKVFIFAVWWWRAGHFSIVQSGEAWK